MLKDLINSYLFYLTLISIFVSGIILIIVGSLRKKGPNEDDQKFSHKKRNYYIVGGIFSIFSLLGLTSLFFLKRSKKMVIQEDFEIFKPDYSRVTFEEKTYPRLPTL